MKKTLLIFLTFFSVLSLFTQKAEATLYLDHELDPYPLITLSVVLPQGASSLKARKQVAAMLLDDLMEAGTQTKTRQEVQDILASFGAEWDFDVGMKYSTWTLEFPYHAKKDYTQLAALLREIWRSPRLNVEEFNKLKDKSRSRILSSVDDDAQNLSGALRRFAKSRFLGLEAFTVEAIDAVQLDDLQNVHALEFFKVPHAWVGYVGPSVHKKLVQNIVQKVFAEQGTWSSKKLLSALPSSFQRPVKKTDSERHILLVDKKGLQQSMMGMLAVNPDRNFLERELDFNFAHYLYTNSGLDSILTREIRGKRGLAYFVASMGRTYLDLPTFGFLSNPQRAKQKEALAVLKFITLNAFKRAEYLRKFPQQSWQEKMRAFRYRYLLQNSTSKARLSLRRDLVRGDISTSFYKSNPEKWSVSKKSLLKSIPQFWKGSSVVLGVLGDAQELKPLIKRSFPEYTLQIIPFKESIRARTYYQ